MFLYQLKLICIQYFLLFFFLLRLHDPFSWWSLPYIVLQPFIPAFHLLILQKILWMFVLSRPPETFVGSCELSCHCSGVISLFLLLSLELSRGGTNLQKLELTHHSSPLSLVHWPKPSNPINHLRAYYRPQAWPITQYACLDFPSPQLFFDNILSFSFSFFLRIKAWQYSIIYLS